MERLLLVGEWRAKTGWMPRRRRGGRERARCSWEQLEREGRSRPIYISLMTLPAVSIPFFFNPFEIQREKNWTRSESSKTTRKLSHSKKNEANLFRGLTRKGKQVIASFASDSRRSKGSAPFLNENLLFLRPASALRRNYMGLQPKKQRSGRVESSSSVRSKGRDASSSSVELASSPSSLGLLFCRGAKTPCSLCSLHD